MIHLTTCLIEFLSPHWATAGLPFRVAAPSVFQKGRGFGAVGLDSRLLPHRINRNQRLLLVRIEGKAAPRPVLWMAHQLALQRIHVQVIELLDPFLQAPLSYAGFKYSPHPTLKSKNRRCQKRRKRSSPSSNCSANCADDRSFLPRSRRETRCFSTWITVEGVPREGSPISK